MRAIRWLAGLAQNRGSHGYGAEVRIVGEPASTAASGSRTTAPPSPWHASAKRIRAGAGLLAISTAIQLLSMWLDWGSVEGSINAVWLSVALGASIWLLVQPWRRRVMIFAVIVTALWTALLPLVFAGQLVGEGTLNFVVLIAFVIGGAGLVILLLGDIARVAAWMTLLVGVASTVMGGSHLVGVLGNASRGAYRLYDFRLASMLSIGIMMVVAGTLCLAAVRGLLDGRRRAWDLAISGIVLLLLVTVPLCFVPVQGDLAAALTFLAAPNLVVLVAARRRLEVA